MKTGNKIRYNSKRRHWRRTKLGFPDYTAPGVREVQRVAGARERANRQFCVCLRTLFIE
uniref:Large ribosomal subunit protein eL39 n=1 Tax=Chelydra serpentina TaxID=8475 RepID=A0A8C3SVR4_CHESE